ncbi:hypothetical protein FGLOB1_1983 [Fusarium globosum]|uniref:C2H2-type domain-containing protein n=1 Tax=Fusarium globosum TaxID=78864 RepID=A0A8H5YRW6_9HYPO|nr:hypothetical protein FGLOB1_1983 [Fusarium globosum]
MDFSSISDLPRTISPGSSYSTHSRPSSRASSHGSIDSGVSHPPRTGIKRKRSVSVGWGEFFGKTSEGEIKRQRTLPDSSRGDVKSEDRLQFACPFFRRSPTHHMNCINSKLYRISDVKQHISRRHSRPSHHCPTCHEGFSSLRQHDDHVQSHCCKPRDLSIVRSVECSVEWVSENASLRLKYRGDRGVSPAEQWYAIWDILFENMPRPDKAFLGSVVEETLGMLRGFWRQEGCQIVKGFLENSQRKPENGSDLEELMLDLFDDFQVRLEQKIQCV